jgi:hypothetical protein
MSTIIYTCFFIISFAFNLEYNNNILNSESEKTDKIKIETEKEKEFKKTFEYGFNEGLKVTWTILIFLYAFIDFIFNKRIPDARYKEGYRTLDIKITDLLKYVFFPIPIAIIAGLIYGVYNFISNLF